MRRGGGLAAFFAGACSPPVFAAGLELPQTVLRAAIRSMTLGVVRFRTSNHALTLCLALIIAFRASS
jgi:hypothetical protein